MYYVEVQKSFPDVRSSWYEFSKLSSAIDFAQASYNQFGVDEVIITDNHDNPVEW